MTVAVNIETLLTTLGVWRKTLKENMTEIFFRFINSFRRCRSVRKFVLFVFFFNGHDDFLRVCDAFFRGALLRQA